MKNPILACIVFLANCAFEIADCLNPPPAVVSLPGPANVSRFEGGIYVALPNAPLGFITVVLRLGRAFVFVSLGSISALKQKFKVMFRKSFMVYKLSPAGINAAMLGSIYPLLLGVKVSAFLPRFKIVSRIAPVTPIFSSCQESPYSKSLSLLVRVILCLL